MYFYNFSLSFADSNQVKYHQTIKENTINKSMYRGLRIQLPIYCVDTIHETPSSVYVPGILVKVGRVGGSADGGHDGRVQRHLIQPLPIESLR